MKRILSLDGGGIRGVFSLQILATIEDLFRREQGSKDLVLADVFDLIAGTSTGAVIATCLSWGMPVRDIEDLYIHSGPEIFSKEQWYLRWKTKYRGDRISQIFRRVFSENADGSEPALLGSKRLRTLLLVVMRNASTGSPWPVTNNPHARFNDSALPDCNLNVPLWQLLRASTAAPVYFPPEQIQLGGQPFLFVDGGMTPFNNPTLIAVLMATLPTYGLRWPATRELLHVISVGTAGTRTTISKKIANDINVLHALKYSALAWMSAVSTEQDFLCRVLGDCVHGSIIDSEVEALDSPTLLSASEQKFTYARYDEAFGGDHQPADSSSQQEAELDDLTLIPFLQRMGRAYASEHVRREHLFPRKTP